MPAKIRRVSAFFILLVDTCFYLSDIVLFLFYSEMGCMICIDGFVVNRLNNTSKKTTRKHENETKFFICGNVSSSVDRNFTNLHRCQLNFEFCGRENQV